MTMRTVRGSSLRLVVSTPVVKVLAATSLVLTALLTGLSSPALAAKPGTGGGGHTGGGGTTSATTGNDLSYPACGSTFPSAPAFGIVGVDGGLANDLNPCLGPSSSYPSYSESELYWAMASSTGITAQPKASLYVNTADPGDLYNGTPIADWPTSSLGSDPYGSCTTTTVSTTSGDETLGANTPGCAWQYGYDMAAQDVSWVAGAAGAIDRQQSGIVVPTSASAYPWWLDVETVNTWQTGTSGEEMNVADLEGMVAALQAAGASTVGAYSTSSQWDQITGGTTSSPLYGIPDSLLGIPDWIPGAKTESGAVSNCGQPSFTGGSVSLTQWSGHPDDNDYAC
ncbi:MAG: glycoside hydrolase family 25 domain-containing protein [Acidimicrobiales bacterium]